MSDLLLIYLFICAGIASPIIFVNILTRIFEKKQVQVADINHKFVILEIDDCGSDYDVYGESTVLTDEDKLDFTW